MKLFSALLTAAILLFCCACSGPQTKDTESAPASQSTTDSDLTDLISDTTPQTVPQTAASADETGFPQDIPPFTWCLQYTGDFWSCYETVYSDPEARISFLHTYGEDSIIGDAAAEQQAVDDWFAAMGRLSVPQLTTGVVTVTYCADDETLCFGYADSEGNPIADLVHFLAANADEISSTLADMPDMQPLGDNSSATAIFVHPETEENALTATVIYKEQVMELTRYGDDRELLIAMLADTGFFFTLESWDIYDYNGVPMVLSFDGADAIAQLFSIRDMDDAAFEAYCLEDSRLLNGIHSRESADHVISLLSRITLPCLDASVYPESFSVWPEADRASVRCPIMIDSVQAARVSFQLQEEYSAVIHLYLSRLQAGKWESDTTTAWMQIGDTQYCAQVAGIYTVLTIYTNESGTPYLQPEQITFPVTMEDWIAAAAG